MAVIRPNAEPAATTVAAGDIFLIDGATGVRALAASQVPIRDANANVPINNLLEGFATTVTAAGTTVLTAASAGQQFFTGTTTQIVQLPVTSTLTALGHSYFFQNASTGAVTVNSSGGNAVKIIGPGTSAIVTCVLLTGTTAASWQPIYFDDIAASGKVLTVSNSLTLAGTDGTTMTFPATSASVARIDAAQTFTGTQAFGALTATTLNGNTFTAGTGVLTIAAAKTLTANNSLTLAGTDGSTLNVGAGGTLGGTAYATPGQIPGEPSTGSAAAGNVGEYIESVIAFGSAISIATATGKTITSISLTPGDWDVDCVGYLSPAATTSVTTFLACLSLVTNATDLTAGRFSQQVSPANVSGGSLYGQPVPPYRFSLSTTTSIFLVVQAAFTVSTATAYGIIRARRAR